MKFISNIPKLLFLIFIYFILKFIIFWDTSASNSLLLSSEHIKSQDNSQIPLEIIQWPIKFDEKRVELTCEYLLRHYGIDSGNIFIVPQIIVIHWTGTPSLLASFKAFDQIVLPEIRNDIKAKGGGLNVSAHYLVDMDGTIYRLMPDNWMARHIIGLNHVSIGIENVGPKPGTNELTSQQLEANERLIRLLAKKYISIEWLIGHMEYARFEESEIYCENVPGYFTKGKIDPGTTFMANLRKKITDLHMKEYP